MESQKILDINIKNFNGRIPFKEDLFEILRHEELIFVRMKREEAHIIKNSKYTELWDNIKAKSGYTDTQLNRTREGNDFARKVCACIHPISVSKSHMSLSGSAMLKQRLAGKDITVKLFL